MPKYKSFFIVRLTFFVHNAFQSRKHIDGFDIAIILIKGGNRKKRCCHRPSLYSFRGLLTRMKEKMPNIFKLNRNFLIKKIVTEVKVVKGDPIERKHEFLEDFLSS